MAATLTPLRKRTSRRPTGLPNPPMMLLVGPEKCGKSFAAAVGTKSDLLGMTYWIEIGGSEGTADYYGRIPGVRYEIVEHDGSFADIRDAIRYAVAQPPVGGKPNMIAVDNMTALWDLLSDEQALFARSRAERKAQENRRRAPGLDDPIVIDPDLWLRAKERWGEILWLLRRHHGPTLLLARQEIVTAFENDKPTREKTRKIKAERHLPSAVDAIVELHSFGEAHLTGVRTLHWDIKPGDSTPFPDFSIDTLLRRLGFEEAAPVRQVTETRPEAYLHEQGRQQQEGEGRQPRQNGLTGPQATELIRKAVTDKTNPEAALQGIREEWGIRTLKQIPTKSNFGTMSADNLITRSLAYIKGQAQNQQQNESQRGTPAGAHAEQGETTSTPPAAVAQGQEREHRGAPPTPPPAPQPEPAPPAEDGAPPPPDPQSEEPPPPETPEDTSAAEEPQDLPPRPTAKRAARKNPNEDIARRALLDEADVQARIKFVTRGDHLQPIYTDGEPGLAQLRDYVQAQRSEVIALLKENDQADLADLYGKAPMPDLALKKKFAAYFDGTPAGPPQ
ncbi:hypothetical protein [Streptomyces sp. NPDC047315]|uniref:hypothetical protein n=1 Tax=Streptomyces sp. NPDC047315 TaxID=3155142 RepID=UPI0033CB424E